MKPSIDTCKTEIFGKRKKKMEVGYPTKYPPTNWPPLHAAIVPFLAVTNVSLPRPSVRPRFFMVRRLAELTSVEQRAGDNAVGRATFLVTIQ